nr:glutamate mutase L [Clostridioides mangenotii]
MVEEAGLERICVESGATKDEINSWIKSCSKNPEILPTGLEQNIDEAMAGEAIRISAARHCGFTETTFSTIGEVLIQTGKDLTGVKYIIGTGGSVTNSRSPINILKKSVYVQSDINLLKPISPEFLLDKKNCFAAMGLLGRLEPEIALNIMKKEFVEIN